LAFKNSKNNYEAAKLRFAEMEKQINFQEKQAQKMYKFLQQLLAIILLKAM
jgi:hypothetical protein